MAIVKDEFLLKIYAGYLIPEEAIAQKIQAHRQLHQQQLETYSSYRSSAPQKRVAGRSPAKGFIFLFVAGLNANCCMS